MKFKIILKNCYRLDSIREANQLYKYDRFSSDPTGLKGVAPRNHAGSTTFYTLMQVLFISKVNMKYFAFSFLFKEERSLVE